METSFLIKPKNAPKQGGEARSKAVGIDARGGEPCSYLTSFLDLFIVVGVGKKAVSCEITFAAPSSGEWKILSLFE